MRGSLRPSRTSRVPEEPGCQEAGQQPLPLLRLTVGLGLQPVATDLPISALGLALDRLHRSEKPGSRSWILRGVLREACGCLQGCRPIATP